MFEWLKCGKPFYGSVLFRGSSFRAEDFDFLKKSGIGITEEQPADNAIWNLKLRHSEWGEANLVNLRKMPAPPADMIEQDVRLTREEKKLIRQTRTVVSLIMASKKDNILRDRKYALNFLHAIMGDDGLAVMDHAAQSIWPREALEAETCHDANIDVEGVFTMHAVTENDYPENQDGQNGEVPLTWLHSHGLGEMGFFDFDILNPSRDLLDIAADAIRAIAYAILEGHVDKSTPSFPLFRPRGNIRFVDVADFERVAKDSDRAFRDFEDDSHNHDRAVICNPKKGLFGRWSKSTTPSKFLSRPIPENIMINFSNAASELMAERARGTCPLLTKYMEEYKDLQFPALVKLGYLMDGGDETDKEHLWFSVHDIKGDEFDATLENQPYYIERMKAGDRGMHSMELLSDWMIMTPAGNVTPRSTLAARLIAPHLDEIRAAIRETT